MKKPYLPLAERLENIKKKLADIKKLLEKAEDKSKHAKNEYELTF